MRLCLLAFLVGLSFLPLRARALVEWASCERVSAVEGLRTWKHDLHNRARDLVSKGEWFETKTGLTECRESTEVAGAFICLSFLQMDMNQIFGRISVWAEGGYDAKTKTLVAHDHLDVQKLNILTQGQDLKSEDINEFFRQAIAKCAEGEEQYCLNAAEQEFYEKILPKMNEKYEKFVVIGFSQQSMGDYRDLMGHEMMHAQYFLNPTYREVVIRYWREKVSDDEKARVRKILSDGYDPENEDLMMNEFHAFILEGDALDDWLKDFVPIHAGPLRQALIEAGTPPIVVQ